MAIDFEDAKKALDRIRSHRAYRQGKKLLRAVLMAGLFLAMAASTLIFFRQNYNHYVAGLLPEFIRSLCELLLLGLELNSVLLTFATYHKEERSAFLSRIREAEEFGVKEERKLLLHGSTLWVELAVMSFFFAISDASLLFGGLSFTATYGISQWVLRLVLIPVFLLLTLALLLYTRIEARRFWLDLPLRMAKKKSFASSRKQRVEHTYSVRRFLSRILGYWLLYLLGASIIPAIIPVVKFIINLGTEALLLLPILPILFLLFLSVFYLRGLCKRSRWIKRLRAFCTAHRIRLNEKSHLWRSVFYDSQKGEYDLLLTVGKKTYACRILAGIKKTNNVYLEANGTCTRVFALHAPARRMTVTGRYAQAINTSQDSRALELIRFTKEFDYRFDAPAGAQKILIFNPVPLKVIYKTDTHHEGELDNGMAVGEYQIYTGGAFLRMLERSLHGDT